MNSWYQPLAAIKSLGQLDEGPGSLAGLHEARKRHLSQFFTPEPIARLAWQIAEQAMPATDGKGNPRRYGVLDNSVGSGRLLQFCDPALHKVGGLDVHAETISQVKQVFDAAGFECDFHTGSMEEARPTRWSAAIINPPFSIHFENPLLQEFDSNTFGRFGPGTSARSDVYALEQALVAADIVVAVVPRSIADRLDRREICDDRLNGNDNRLRLIFDLPSGSFKEEGAEVEVSLAVFGQPCEDGWGGRHKLESLQDSLPALPRKWHVKRCGHDAKIHWVGLDSSKPSITLPVTGDKVVRLVHDGRKIGLRFCCGFTQARVMNAILEGPARVDPNGRLPKQYPFAGSSRLDLEAHIATGDTMASLQRLVGDIESCDATVEFGKGFMEHVRRRERRSRAQGMPLAHVVWADLPASAKSLVATARHAVVTDPKDWWGWIINEGEAVEFHRLSDGRYGAKSPAGASFVLTLDELQRDFLLRADVPSEGWREVHPGLLATYPAQAAALRKKMVALGIDKWLTWDYQTDDLIELLLKPKGATCAWEMGLGKTRLAVAMILLSGVKHGLVTMDAYLIPEFVGKLEELPIAKEDWQVIDHPSKLDTLKRINLISYERLRSKLPGKGRVAFAHRLREQPEQGEMVAVDFKHLRSVLPSRMRLTYAHRLRRRIGMLLADEGEVLANGRSAQSVALWQVAARRCYVMSATPQPNYPRNMLAIMAFTGGDGTAAQPWGYFGPHMTPALALSASFSQRGPDAFRDEFVTLEWCTNEFADTLTSGGKREIPKIANLALYRQALAPHIKRRIVDEPAVQQHIQIPKPELIVHEVDFDDAHLGYYLTVAEEFADWWATAQGDGTSRRVSSMLKILLKIGAVVRANNLPQRPEKNSRVHWGDRLTSKQRFTLDRLEYLVGQGEKIILLVQSPETVELFHRLLAFRDIPSIRFHGGIPISRRYKAMDKHFRKGNVQVLEGTYGCTQAGMDLPQATRVVRYDRCWTYKEEEQSLRRALRPQTKHTVTEERIHLRGGIDIYMDQMVAFKRDSFRAGLDWATPEYADADFEHFNTIIGRFLRELAEMRGKKVYDLTRELQLLAA